MSVMGSLRQFLTYYCSLAVTTIFPCMCKEPASWRMRGSNLHLIGMDGCAFNTTRGCQFRKRCTPQSIQIVPHFYLSRLAQACANCTRKLFQ